MSEAAMIGLALEPGAAIAGSFPLVNDFDVCPLNERLDVGGTTGEGLGGGRGRSGSLSAAAA